MSIVACRPSIGLWGEPVLTITHQCSVLRHVTITRV
jgi:hypothetical protein